MRFPGPESVRSVPRSPPPLYPRPSGGAVAEGLKKGILINRNPSIPGPPVGRVQSERSAVKSKGMKKGILAAIALRHFGDVSRMA